MNNKQTIEVTFPAAIPPESFKYMIEGGLEKGSKYNCEVEHTGIEKDGENLYTITTSDGPEAFYYIGMMTAMIIEIFEKER